MKLDPRIDTMFRGRPPHERFLAVAMCAILSAMPNRMLEQVMGQVKGDDVDWSEIIAGRPLFHYNGKSRGQLRRERVPEETIDAVAAALEKRGIKMVEDTPPTAAPDENKNATAAPPVNETASQIAAEELLGTETAAAALPPTTPAPGSVFPTPPGEVPNADAPADASAAAATPPDKPDASAAASAKPAETAPEAEPVFAGKPLSFFKGKTRDQILAVEGMSPTVATKVQQALKKQE